jgi:signal transduction histidine kinase
MASPFGVKFVSSSRVLFPELQNDSTPKESSLLGQTGLMQKFSASSGMPGCSTASLIRPIPVAPFALHGFEVQKEETAIQQPAVYPKDSYESKENASGGYQSSLPPLYQPNPMGFEPNKEALSPEWEQRTIPSPSRNTKNNLLNPILRDKELLEQAIYKDPTLSDPQLRQAMVDALRNGANKMLVYIKNFLDGSKLNSLGTVDDEKGLKNEVSSQPINNTLQPGDWNHELRNTLNNILCHLKCLEEQEDRLSPILMLQISYNHLSSVAADIIDLNNVKPIRLKPERFTIKKLVERLSATTANNKGVEIEFRENAFQNENQVIEGDLTRLTQILVNLISNAVKFAPMNDYVSEKVIVNIDLEKDLESAATIKFGVTNGGPCIPVEKQKLLFQRFSQLENQPDGPTESGSSGLGLLISQKCVELMGGKSIQVHSPLDQATKLGTRFDFVLPFNKIDDRQIRVISPSTPKTRNLMEPGPLWILVADDEGTTRKAFARWYGSNKFPADYIADIVNDGSVAVENFSRSEQPYQVVILDMTMPILGGWEAARRINEIALKRMQPLPLIIFCTGEVGIDELQAEAAKSNDPALRALANEKNVMYYIKPTPFAEVVKQSIEEGTNRLRGKG